MNSHYTLNERLAFAPDELPGAVARQGAAEKAAGDAKRATGAERAAKRVPVSDGLGESEGRSPSVEN